MVFRVVRETGEAIKDVAATRVGLYHVEVVGLDEEVDEADDVGIVLERRVRE